MDDDHMKPLAGKVAIVTGTSAPRGIGRAIAMELADAGAHVFLSGRTAAPMEEAKKEIAERGGRGVLAGFFLC